MLVQRSPHRIGFGTSVGVKSGHLCQPVRIGPRRVKNNPSSLPPAMPQSSGGLPRACYESNGLCVVSFCGILTCVILADDRGTGHVENHPSMTSTRRFVAGIRMNSSNVTSRASTSASWRCVSCPCPPAIDSIRPRSSSPRRGRPACGLPRTRPSCAGGSSTA